MDPVPATPPVRTERTLRQLLANVLVWTGTAATVVVLVVILMHAWASRRPGWAAIAAAGAALVGVVGVMTLGRHSPEAEAPPEGVEARPPAFDPFADPLTGLLNRAGLVEELQGSAQGADRNGLALLFLRADRLDRINGRLGRAVGDEVLRALAGRLREATGASPADTRISGTTFVSLRHESHDADAWAARVVECLTEPVLISGLVLHVSCAAVLVATDGFHHDADTLLAEAEAAAQGRIATGRSRVEHVRLSIDDASQDTIGIAAQVQHAVCHGGISAEYQPVIDLRTMEPVGVEALARWRGAPRGLAAPAEFLGVAGALGLLPDVFDQILFDACRDFASGPAADRGWWVSVNLAKDDCVDQTLPSRVSRILADTGLEPSRLVLEISERVIPDPAAERALRNLAELGVKLAIDDFGSGWSSLAQLRSLPISLIKIDQSLVTSPTTTDARLTMSTIAIAAALGIEALAEGVESGEDLLLLCLAECQYGQGFWWSEADTLDAILAKFPTPDPDADDGRAPVFDLDALRTSSGRSVATAPPDDVDVEAVLETALRDLPMGAPDQLPRLLEGSAAPSPAVAGEAKVERAPLVLGEVEESAWLDISDEDFLAKLRTICSVRPATTA